MRSAAGARPCSARRKAGRCLSCLQRLTPNARALLFSTAPMHTFTLGSWLERPLEEFIRGIENSWGTGANAPRFAPEQCKDGRFPAWWGRYERNSASPNAAGALARMNAAIDVRSVLSTIRVPTLVIHRRDDSRIKFAGGRYLAEKIAGARFCRISRARPSDLDGGYRSYHRRNRGIPDWFTPVTNRRSRPRNCACHEACIAKPTGRSAGRPHLAREARQIARGRAADLRTLRWPARYCQLRTSSHISMDLPEPYAAD
jgi:hypothetical protein